MLAVSIGCGPTGPGTPYSHSAAMFGCGPADQPATVIVFADRPIAPGPLPDLRVTILKPLDALAGRGWTIGDTAYAIEVVGGDAYVSAESGSVVVTAVDATKRVFGLIDLYFSFGRVTTAFNAPWIESGQRCG